ncbi:hypothetical protein [Sphaerisporangium fuscum]|uniref:hypothetical protein n=1 Tax=Sphaerisporangium fuscum TaxID=2835868 RepID=UPI001BDD1218|nr:hypothetical protein [Sphaerisporangium fuscum]
MAWVSDEAVGHEGWDAAVFSGGRVSVGSGGGGALVRRDGPDGLDDTGAPEVVSGHAAIGWRSMCECGWRGPLWRRASSPEEHDRAARLVWVEVDQYGDASEDIRDAMRAEWSEHLPPARLAAVGREARAVEVAQARLTGAVHAAREAGHSWADIGEAVGITRQSAHERWAKPLVPDRAFGLGDRVRLLVTQHVSYTDDDLADEGEDAQVRFTVRSGTVCRIVKVREYPTPFPYVVLTDDDREFGIAEHDIERVAQGT